MLKYYFGTMASGKSATLLMNVYQKENNGIRCLVLKPNENRDGEYISSRVGLSRRCMTFTESDSMYEIINNKIVENKIQEIYIDECQFLSKEQVKQIWNISNFFNITINCFGLKTTYKNELFTGASALMVYADSIIEIKPSCTCKYCKGTATTHLLVVDDKVVLDFPEKFEGDIQGATRFECVCQFCWNEKTKNIHF